MIKVLLKDGDPITGDWTSAEVKPRMAAGEVLTATLELKGEDNDASFLLGSVIGWMQVKPEATAGIAKKVMP